MSDLVGNHIVGFPTRRLKYERTLVYIIVFLKLTGNRHLHGLTSKPSSL